MTKDLKEAKEEIERQNWLDQFLQCKIWEMAGEGEGDKSRIKSASSQGWQALKILDSSHKFQGTGRLQKIGDAKLKTTIADIFLRYD